ncbi:hypothetical protein [Paraburkholderia tropica]|uniref:hypothetical protein n=1 Tax=Paraburkholderia tropica TaxID=92647 RepID=UPI003D2D3108
MPASKEVFVRVDGEDVQIWVTQSAKTVWRAHGTFRDKQIVAKGSSESNAIASWKQQADYAAKA